MGDSLFNHEKSLSFTWPAWLTMARARVYSGWSEDKLVSLAKEGEIIGYQNGGRGKGEWNFKTSSIDEYHDRHSGWQAIDLAVKKTCSGARR